MTRAAAQSDTAPVMSVSQLNRMVSAALSAALPEKLLVAGEIADISRPSSGHLYFTLKDSASLVRCVMWRSTAEHLKFKPTDGMAVLATGGIEVYEPRGQYQFYVRRLEPQGIGALELAFRQLKEKLAKEGLFDAARKRKLPAFPRRIAVVTSLSGAAIRDILQTIHRRCPAVHVLVCPVRVQGEGSAQEVAIAIRRINEQADRLGGIDVLIVGRGGGSLEDLWAFNEEIVARAIFASKIPIVSAVGHEVDFTIADFVADVRAATPTAAAELVVPMLADIIEHIALLQSRITRGVRRELDLSAAQLAGVLRSEWFRDSVSRVRQKQQRVDEAAGRLNLTATRRLKVWREALHHHERILGRIRPEIVLAQRRERLGNAEHRLRWALRQAESTAERQVAAALARLTRATPQRLIDRYRMHAAQAQTRMESAAMNRMRLLAQQIGSMHARLSASSHEQVLNRGFSITRDARSGRIIRSRMKTRVDQRIITRVADGEFGSKVVDIKQGELFE